MKTIPCLSVLFVIGSHTGGYGQGIRDKALSDLVVENVQIVVTLENIQLSFLARDPEGNFIRSLSASDFVLFENGRPQKIALLREEEIPISAVVMVDTSWSIGHFLENAVRTAVDFFKDLERERSAFVLFSESPRVVLNWQDPSTDLSGHLRNVKPDGKTALYDSVIWTAENLFQGRTGKRLIILFTDGIDTKSRASFEDMIRISREHGITLYPIIYTNHYIQDYRKRLSHANPPWGRRISLDFHSFIVQQNRFVDQSLRYGGRTIFSNAFADLRDIYTNIIQEMKSQYVMVYQSSLEDREGRLRDVKVQTRKVAGKIFINIGQ